MQPIEVFADRDQASAAAAQLLADSLRLRLGRDADAVLVVSGGTTPVACFHRLAQAELPWDRVTVMLTDERCVPRDHPQSNQRLVEANLLQGNAASATFRMLEPAQLAATPAPFAAVLLGMGEDGHFASLFHDAGALASGLDPESPRDLIEVRTAASPHARVSMTMARLLRADRVILLVFGEAKRQRLRDPAGTPVAALLRQQNRPVSILWSP